MDDRRRCPPPGGRDPGRGALGHVHDRRRGPPDHDLRNRAGTAVPHPVPRRRRGHRAPPGARHARRIAPGHDGRRRREVRRLAHHLRALLGRRPLDGAVLRRPGGERGLAVDRSPIGLDRRPPAARTRLSPDRLLHRDDRVGPPAGRRDRVPRGARHGDRHRAARSAVPAGRLLAQLPASLPRDQRPPQADAADVGEGRRDGRGCRP